MSKRMLQRSETQRWSVERSMTTQERCHDEIVYHGAVRYAHHTLPIM